jgi:hypothetical protein
MANIKISQLITAGSALGTQEFEVNESGTSKKVTGSQIKTYVKDGLVVSDIVELTATAAELNTLDGITASTAELNTLTGLTASTAELNYVDGVTSAIQTQLDAKYDSGALASQAEAQAGTDNTKLMTPLRVAQAIAPDYTSSGFTLTRDYRGTFAHGLGATPSLITMRLRCVTAQFNFSVNDVVYIYSGGFDPTSGQAFQFTADTTNIYLGTYWTYLRNKTTGTGNAAWVEITYANWQATIVAWK